MSTETTGSAALTICMNEIEEKLYDAQPATWPAGCGTGGTGSFVVGSKERNLSRSRQGGQLGSLPAWQARRRADEVEHGDRHERLDHAPADLAVGKARQRAPPASDSDVPHPFERAAQTSRFCQRRDRADACAVRTAAAPSALGRCAVPRPPA